MGFNENLKLLLLEKNMKQADLCRMTGIQTSLMSEYINGRKKSYHRQCHPDCRCP